MENRFAGAADVAQRRRRRLANEDPDSSPSSVEKQSALFADDAHDSATHVDSQLLRRIISPRPWKHVAVLAISFIAVSALYWGVMRTTDEAGPVNRTVGGLSGLLILLASQLAVVIGWIRARSEFDFQGRYRWWKWLAVGLAILSALQLTGTFDFGPSVLVTFVEALTGPIQAARNAVVLVPVVTFSVVVLARVIPDMGRCFLSQGFLTSAVLILVVRQMLVFGTSAGAISDATFNVLTLTSAWSAFGAMLIHARYVAYISNDPPMAASMMTSEPSDQAEYDGPVSKDAEEIPVVETEISKAPKKSSKRNSKPTKSPRTTKARGRKNKRAA